MLPNGNQGPQFSYEYDVDADEDGIPDAIWMDLDFPIVDLPDGRQFVPLFGFKVIDADALLNVNAHGNMNNFITRLADGSIRDFGGTAAAGCRTSRSMPRTRGCPPVEVNLSLAFSSNPSLDRNMDGVIDGYDPLAGAAEVRAHRPALQGSPVVPVEALDVEDSLLQYGRNFLADILPAFRADTADPASAVAAADGESGTAVSADRPSVVREAAAGRFRECPRHPVAAGRTLGRAQHDRGSWNSSAMVDCDDPELAGGTGTGRSRRR